MLDIPHVLYCYLRLIAATFYRYSSWFKDDPDIWNRRFFSSINPSYRYEDDPDDIPF